VIAFTATTQRCDLAPLPAKAGLHRAASPTRADFQELMPPGDGSRLSPGKTITRTNVFIGN
jgi:hypothetical protein